ncbi:MAG TPA: hypothetical protein VGJ29_15095 [Vicinamibacterales bacterium]
MTSIGTPNQQVSPRQAVIFGLLFMGAGLAIVLAGFGIIPVTAAPDVKDSPWVIVCAGLAFVFGGAAVIVDFAVVGGTGPDGDLPAGTPFAIRLVQYVLGLGIIGMLTAICTWISIGRGHRQFSTTISLPFVSWHPASDETVGRFMFGVAAALLWLMFIGLGLAGARRLVRAGVERNATL